MHRTWTADENISDENRAVLDILMKEWNEIEAKIEERDFRSDEDIEAEAEYFAEMENEHPGCTEDHTERQNAEMKALHLKQEALSKAMAALGGRLARPYEHWNEEERYMEYMENRNDE